MIFLQPWLLEINSSPALGATTSTTARLCANVLEDVIKVILCTRLIKKLPQTGYVLFTLPSTILRLCANVLEDVIKVIICTILYN